MVTFVAELRTPNLPQLYLWDPDAYKDSINSFTLYHGIVLGISGLLALFLTIVFPLCGNVTVTIVTLSFLSVWNEFVFANTFMTAASMKTLPIGLNDFVGAYGKTDFGLTYAAIMVSILPTLILYFFLNKRVISGVAAGATK